MARQDDTVRKPKATVQARVDADALAKLDQLAAADRRTRSELIDFAVREYVDRHATNHKSRSRQ